jgi:predicted chitinase
MIFDLLEIATMLDNSLTLEILQRPRIRQMWVAGKQLMNNREAEQGWLKRAENSRKNAGCANFRACQSAVRISKGDI